MKKTSSLLLGILILSSISFAKDITLDEAVTLAKQNDSTLISLTAQQKQQEKDYKSVKKDTQKWQSKSGYSFSTAQEYLLHHGDSLEAAQLKYDAYLKSIENAEDTVEYNLKSTVYNLELAEKNIKLLEENVELMEKQKLVYELKYKLNWITKLELDNFILSLNQIKNTLENAKAKYALGKESVRIMLGSTEEINVILPEIEINEIIIEDINAYYKENIDNNKSLIELKHNYKTIENQYMCTKEGFFDETIANVSFQTKLLKDQYDAMKQQIEIATNNLYTVCVTYYNDVKMSDLSLVDQKNKLELAKTNMEILKIRYDAGYVAELDYKSAVMNLEQSELAYESERISNMLLKEKFNKFINSGMMIAQ